MAQVLDLGILELLKIRFIQLARRDLAGLLYTWTLPHRTTCNNGGFCENRKFTVTATSAVPVYNQQPVLPEPPIYTVRDESSLNRADPEEIDRSKAILDGYQLRLLGMIDKKIQKHPQRYDRDQYRQTASFLILCNSPSAQRLAFCGIPSAINPSGRCRLHQYCPYCCWRERTAAQLTYVPSFYNGNWHFLTGSFEGDLGFTCSDGYDWLHYWDAYKHGLSALVEEGLIDGAYWTEELAVNSFLPTRVLPHIHAIIDAAEFTDSTLEILKERIAEYLPKQVGPDFLPPDVKVSAVQDEKTLFDTIGYMLKPMKLVRAYERAWPAASFNNRARAWELNSELTDLIKGHSQILRRRPKMRAKGTLNPRAKIFIGVRKKDHCKQAHQELINELKRQPAAFIQAGDEEPAPPSSSRQPQVYNNDFSCTAFENAVQCS